MPATHLTDPSGATTIFDRRWRRRAWDYARWQLRQRRRAVTRAPVQVWHRLQWLVSSPESIAQWTERRLGIGDRYWLFVLGLNNSGTSLISHIIGQHPEIRQMPSAGQGLTSGIPRARDHGVSRNWTQKPDLFRLTEDSDAASVLRVQYDWARLYPTHPGILLEKSPPNTMRSRWLQRHFQPCRFVAIVRNPYAVCEGIRRREGISIEDAAQHWTRGNEYLLTDLPFLNRVLFFSYEAFCEDVERHLRLLDEFLELGTPLDRAITAGDMPTHNLEGTPQPITNLNDRSLERLSATEKQTIGRIAAPVLSRLGYERL